jgi:hypothetical protein
MIFSLGMWRKIEKIGKQKKSLLPFKQLLDDVKNDDFQKKNFSVSVNSKIWYRITILQIVAEG